MSARFTRALLPFSKAGAVWHCAKPLSICLTRKPLPASASKCLFRSQRHEARHVHGGTSNNTEHTFTDPVQSSSNRSSNTTPSDSTGSDKYGRSRTIFVGDLPFEADEQMIADLFTKECGAVLKVSIPLETARSGLGVVKKPKGFAFVEFMTPESAELALKRGGWQMLGRTLRVLNRTGTKFNPSGFNPSQASSPDHEHDEPPTAQVVHAVYVGGIPFSLTEQDIHNLFSKDCGPVLKVSLPHEIIHTPAGVTKRYKGYAFVEFSTADQAALAVQKFDGTTLMGRVLHVDIRKKNVTVRRADSQGAVGVASDAAPDAAPRTEPASETAATHTPVSPVLQPSSMRAADTTKTPSPTTTTLPPSPQPRPQAASDAASARAATDSGAAIYCSGFPLDVTREQLLEVFAGAGAVTGISIPSIRTRTPAGLKDVPKGFAFVTFGSELEAFKAVELLDGFKIAGRSLKVRLRNSAAAATATTSDDAAATAVARTAAGDRNASVPAAEEQVAAVSTAATEVPKSPAEAPAASSQAAAAAATEPPQTPTPAAPAAPMPVVAPVAQPKRSGRQEKLRRKEEGKEVALEPGMSVRALSDRMGVRVVEVVKSLIKLGEEPKTVAHELSLDLAELVVTSFGLRARRPDGADSLALGRRFSDAEYAALPTRAPVVTIMGHVDHGKTTLLDFLRQSAVAAGEAGGITQSIAAFEVERPRGRICFIDTPGHRAFSAMRERGARATDVIVLVVSAADGVQPQTVEVIQHARNAQVPLVVAVNKVDLPGVDPARVLEGLAAHGVVAESLGGDVQAVPVSGLKGTNMEALEDAILLLAEMMELRAPCDGPAEGFVVEARKDKALGPVANVIVTMGALRVGDFVVAGEEWGRVRTLRDFKGKPVVDSAGPSSVVEVTGFRGQPAAGEELFVVPSESTAVSYTDRIALLRLRAPRNVAAAARAKGAADAADDDSTSSTSADSDTAGGGQSRELPLVVKADVDGGLEALVAAVSGFPRAEVSVRVVHADMGPVTEHDVDVAAAARAAVFTFNCRPPSAAVAKHARAKGVEIMDYKVIYSLLDEVERRLVMMLPREEKEEVVGEAKVIKTFELKGKGGAAASIVAGCRVVSGSMQQSTCLQVVRDGDVVHEGSLTSLRHNKDVVKAVAAGSECGVLVDKFTDFQPGDVIKCISRTVTQRTRL